MNTMNSSQLKDRHFLIAVDDSESSKRAVLYVADIVGGFPGFAVTLLSIIPEPEEDFFDSEEEQVAWTRGKLEAANRMLENYRQDLIHAGFPPEKVRSVTECKPERCSGCQYRLRGEDPEPVVTVHGVSRDRRRVRDRDRSMFT